MFLDKYDKQIFKNNNTEIWIIYRNYSAKNREKELLKIAKECKKKRKQLFISNDMRLTLKVKADGLYIPSFNKTGTFLNLERKNIRIIGSAHNQKEISNKIFQRCCAIFLSPVFFVKKSNYMLGLHKFNYLSNNNKVDFYALGGISKDNINSIKLLNIKGFGGKSIFKKKTGLVKGRFL